MTQWSDFRDYVNAAEIGSIITRQNVLHHVYIERKQWTGYSRYTTIDSYRMILDRLGILEKYKRGQYKVNHHIREDVSLETLKRYAYPKRDWREWFIPKEDRVKLVIQR